MNVYDGIISAAEKQNHAGDEVLVTDYAYRVLDENRAFMESIWQYVNTCE